MNTDPAPSTTIAQHSTKQIRSLVTTSWILIGIVIAISLVPFFGFASWLIGAPVLFITLIMGILVLSRGGTIPGLLILLTSLIFAPVFIAVAPFISSLLGLAGTGAVLSAHDQPSRITDTTASSYSAARVTPVARWPAQQSAVTSQHAAGGVQAADSAAGNGSRAAADRENERRRKMLADARKLIVGTWRYEDSQVTYNPDGTKIDKYDNGWITKCSWSIDGDTLISTAFERNGKPFSKHSRFRILELTNESLVSRDQGGKEWRAARIR